MARATKQKKSISSVQPRSYSDLYKNAKSMADNVKVGTESASSNRDTATKRELAIDWRGEYGYVLDDLRRLGLITLILVVAMVVASFFI